MVECREFPQLDTYAAFCRDAIVHRLHYLADKVNDPPTKRELQAALLAVEVEHRKEMKESARSYVATIAEALSAATTDSERNEALSDAMMMVDYLHNYPDLVQALETLIARYDWRA
jgi:phytoene/squalene synthetase